MASKKFYVDIDLEDNQMLNATVGSNDFISTTEGAIGYNSSSGFIQYRDGTVTHNIASQIYVLDQLSGFSSTASNGLSVVNGAIQLGGDLLHPTTISGVFPNEAPDKTFVTGTGFNSDVLSLAVQTDGKVVAGGNFGAYNGVTVGYSIARLNTDGSLDTSFNSNVGTGFNNSVYSIGVQSTGSIVLGGDFSSFDNGFHNGVVRLNSDGTPDATFQTNVGQGAGQVLTVTVQPDDKILVGGNFTTFNFNAIYYLIRLNSDGTPDTSFTTNMGSGFNNAVFPVALNADGSMIIGGYFTMLNGLTQNYIAKLGPDGTPDSTFNTNVGTGFDASVFTLAIQSDGKIVVGGLFQNYNGSPASYFARLNADGTLDATFMTAVGSNFDSQLQIVAVQPDGKIVVGGSFQNFNGIRSPYIARLNADGTFDATFDQIVNYVSQTPFAIVPNSDGSTYVGYAGLPPAIYKLKPQNYDVNVAYGDEINMSIGSSNSTNSLQMLDHSITSTLSEAGNTTTLTTTIDANSQFVEIQVYDTANNAISNYTQTLSGITMTVQGAAQSTNISQTSTNVTLNTPDSQSILTMTGTMTSLTTQMGNLSIVNNTSSLSLLTQFVPDATFNLNLGTGLNGYATIFFMQNSGQYMLTGNFTTYNNIPVNGVVLINANGSLDTYNNFSVGAGFTGNISSVVQDPNTGKFYFAGLFTAYRGNTTVNNLARLNLDGSLDTSYVTNYGGGFSGGSTRAINIIFHPNTANLYVLGDFTSYNGNSIASIVRINAADGSFDTSFATTGFDAFNNDGFHDYPYSNWGLAIDGNDGHLYVGNSGFISYNTETVNGGVIKINDDGTRDTSFTGGVFVGPYNTVSISDINFFNNKLLVCGVIHTYNGTIRDGLLRLNTDGSLDATFLPSPNSFPYFYTGATVNTISTYTGNIVIKMLQDYIYQLNDDGSIDTQFLNYIAPVNALFASNLGTWFYDGSEIIFFYSSQTLNRYLIGDSIQVTEVPINYVDDYSLNYTDRSLVDRGYVLGQLSGVAITASNGVQRTMNDVELGGPITMDTAIDTSGHGFILGNAIDGQLEFHTGFITSGITNGGEGGILTTALDNSSSLFIAGSIYSINGDNVQQDIAKLKSNGTTVASWAHGYFNSGAHIASVAYDPINDKLYCVGSFFSVDGSSTYRFIVRLNNSDGTIDSGFTPGSSFAPTYYYPTAVAYDSVNHKIYVSGPFSSYNGTGVPYLIRLNTDGTLDTAFNASGATSARLNLSAVNKILIDNVNGWVYYMSDYGIQRFALTDGTVDGTYGPSFNNYILNMDMNTVDYTIMAVGQFTYYITHLNYDGSVDTSFATGIGTGFNNIPTAVAYDFTQHNYIVAGNVSSFNGTGINGIARLATDGTIIALNGVTSGFGSINRINDVRVTSSGAFYVSGDYVYFNSVTHNGLVRLNPDGSLDATNSVKLYNQFSNLALNPATGSIVSSSSNNNANDTTSVVNVDSANQQITNVVSDTATQLVSNVTQTQTGVVLQSTDNSIGRSVSIGVNVADSEFLITDGRATATGIQYAADYSANYTSRSLVDKGYVTNALGGAIPQPGSGINVSGSVVNLGGILNQDTLIYDNSQGAHIFEIGQGGNEMKSISFLTALNNFKAGTVLDSNIGSVATNVADISNLVNTSSVQTPSNVTQTATDNAAGVYSSVTQSANDYEINTYTGVALITSIQVQNAAGQGTVVVRSGGAYSTSGYTSIESWYSASAAIPVAPLNFANTGFPTYDQQTLTYYNGLYYGLADSTIYSFDPATNATVTLYTLNSSTEGSSPNCIVFDATANLFYGTCYAGGGGGQGTLFTFDPSNNTFTKVYQFVNSTGYFPQGIDLYPASGEYYGTTFSGGPSNRGVIFKYNFSTNTYTELFDFNNTSNNGYAPIAKMHWNAAMNLFYGTTWHGGSYSNAFYIGVIFTYDPATTTYAVVYNFNPNDQTGTFPINMVLDPNGSYYGLTNSAGGVLSGAGKFFKFDPSTNIYTKLYDVSIITDALANQIFHFGISTDGVGNYYGTTSTGGVTGSGFLWQYNINSNVYKVYYDFDSTLSSHNAGVFSVMTYDSTRASFYGVSTWYNGVNGQGAVFEFSPDYFMKSAGLKISSTGVTTFTDSRGSGNLLSSTPAGIEYASDYSSTYTNRSLVDKQYVDNAIGGASSYKATITGDNTTTDFSITHSLGTRDLIVQVYRDTSPYDMVITTVQLTTTSAIDVIFSVAPSGTDSYRVLIKSV